jgi:hypothetical protein
MSTRKDGKPKAPRKDRKTHGQYISELQILHDDKIIMLNKYTTKRNKGKYQCRTCDHVWESQAGGLVRSNNPTGCPSCAKAKNLNRLEELSASKIESTRLSASIKIKEIYGDSYKLLTEYEHHRKKLRLECKLHGEFKQRYDLLLDGHGCSKCGNEARATSSRSRYTDNLMDRQEDFLQKFEQSSKGEYKLLTEYISINKYVKIRHKKCNHSWDVTPANFIWNERRCPKCNISKGEEKTTVFFKGNSVNHSCQHNPIKENKRLRYDFNVQDMVYLEYDGEQHFKPYYRLVGDEGIKQLKRTQRNDKIKNQYCIDNNIPLIRIPY